MTYYEQLLKCYLNAIYTSTVESHRGLWASIRISQRRW